MQEVRQDKGDTKPVEDYIVVWGQWCDTAIVNEGFQTENEHDSQDGLKQSRVSIKFPNGEPTLIQQQISHSLEYFLKKKY
jgi:Flp pilus assembly protein CpaB